MEFLRECIQPGMITSCYSDTDSLAVATCCTAPLHQGMTPREELEAVFDPILRTEKRDYWYANWDKWFVLTNEVEDEKKPGKLKCKFISLSEKSFSYK